jgi:arylformamidase
VIRDITRVLAPGLPAWPGDPPFEVESVASLSRGDVFEVTRLTMSVHAASHLDAPSHVLRGGGDLGSVPLDLLIGPARLVHLPVSRPIAPEDLPAALLDPPGGPPPGPRRLLVRTESAEALHETFSSFATITEEAAARIAASGFRLLGIDTPSVDPPDAADPAAHRRLARAGAAILEWLDLRGVPEGEYFLVALPLRLQGVEASPVRAVLLEEAPAPPRRDPAR